MRYLDKAFYMTLMSYISVMLIMGFQLSSAIPVHADSVVTFPDPNLEAAIRNVIGKPTGDIHQTDLVNVTSLTAEGKEITSLSGIEFCTNLESLNLDNYGKNDLERNRISDISELANLTHLSYLYLFWNEINDVSALANLTHLWQLDLGHNHITDISALSNLINLHSLSLHVNQISNISVLANLTNLSELVLGDNQINDISVLANLANLRSLSLWTNQISDITVLTHLTNLWYLDLDHNQINDISALANMTTLQRLFLDYNSIKHISALANLTNLQYLTLSQTDINDISTLKNMINLKQLYLFHDPITDISALANLTNLQALYFGDNQISDISALANLINLEELTFYQNQITDISSLVNLTKLQLLYAGDNPIKDISSLANLIHLDHLEIQQSQINDISPLANLINLHQIDLQKNHIADISALVANTGISSGDDVRLWFNDLNISSGSQNMADIQTLINRGVNISYQPQNTYTLTINISPTGSGTVATDIAGPHYYGDVVTLTPTANAGYTFSGFSSNVNPTSHKVTITDNTTVLATFTQNTISAATVTTTTLTSSLNPSLYGQLVTFNVTVSAVPPAAGTPTGMVIFKDGSITLSAVSLNASGQASCSTPALAVGSHNITASYNGDSVFLASAASLTLTINVPPNVPGNLWSWGDNSYGQLGNGTNINSNIAVQGGVSGLSAIAAGYYHSLALTSDGTVWAWGDNCYGQLGNETINNSNIPVQVSGLSEIDAIAAGGLHSLALKSDGTVWAWGYNYYGQLGNETTSNSNIPVQVSGLSGVAAIAAGGAHSLALKSDGSIWAWGYNTDGQLGNGGATDSNVPVQVSGLSGVSAIAGGGWHSLALKSDGTVWTWGNNLEGELGNGSNTGSSMPVQVSGLNGISAIAGGVYHSLALRNDGIVWAWGRNDYSQLGIGNNTTSNVPVQVSGLSGAIAIAGGLYHSLALKSDGTVWAWGINNKGQLGNGTNTSSSVPVRVGGLSGVLAIAAGWDHNQEIIPLASQQSSIMLTSSLNPSPYGQLVTFNATVSALPPASGIPTGTVTIKDGNTHLGTWKLSSSGQATWNCSTLSAGSHIIDAIYNGDADYAVSTSNLTQIVNQGLTMTNLTSSANPSGYGQLVTFNATVSAIQPASGIPTGMVTFKFGNTELVTLNLSSTGQATCSASALSVGIHTVSAAYYGDDNFAGSTGTFTQTVNPQAQLLTGWNTFSTPISLDPASSTLDTILSGSAYDLVYRFNAQTQSWETMNTSDQLKPCDALYIHMTEPSTANLVINPNLTSPPSKTLYAGWNLVSLANMEAMTADLALSSVDKVTGDLTGYTQVLSQALGNQTGWTYVKGQYISDGGTNGWMQPYEGYWVFMVNNGTLAGFTTTPLNGGSGGGGGGAPPVDNTPPVVTSTNPDNNATWVGINAPIKATFSEALNASTVTTATFNLMQTQGGTAIPGNVTYANNVATFTPSANLAYSTSYTATLTGGAGGVKDLAGNPLASDYTWSFTTVSQSTDTTPPTLSSTSPANNASGVAISIPVKGTFSEALDASTITTATFGLTQTQGGTAVQGTVTYANNIATFTPSANLTYNTSYTASITTGVRDLAGNHLAADYTWSFTTLAQSSAVAVSLSGAPDTVTWNDTCEVSVNIANVTNLAAYEFNINYDPSVLQVIGSQGGPGGVTPGPIGSTSTLVDSWVYVPAGTPGVIYVVGHLANLQGVSGSGYMAKIHFKVISHQGKTTNITFTNMPANRLFDPSAAQIPVGTWSGTTVNITAS